MIRNSRKITNLSGFVRLDSIDKPHKIFVLLNEITESLYL
jgi:hypothetical protein